MTGRRGFVNTTTTNNNNKSPSTNHQHTNLDDDWETDPDFERRMDEMDQRWGAKRSVGSINMTKLIDEVHNDHKSIMKERFLHPSQSATIDQHSTSTTSKKIIKSSTSSSSTGGNSIITKTNNSTTKEHLDTGSKGQSINDMKKTLFERSGYQKETVRPAGSTASAAPLSSVRPQYERDTDFKERLNRFNNSSTEESLSSPARKGYDTSKSHKILRDEIGSTRNRLSSNTYASSPSPTKTYAETQSKAREIRKEIEDEVPKAFKSIQAKIDAYKKELDELKETMSRKTHLSSSSSSDKHNRFQTQDKSENIEFVDSEKVRSTNAADPDADIHGSIKSMKDKFHKLLREDEEEFRRRTEARRKQFFEEIESQVHETRRGLDGFDTPMMDEEFEEMKRKFLERNRDHLSSPTRQYQQQATKSPSPTAAPTNSKHVYGSHSSLGAPKVYTKRETHREEVVSKIVKENDKVIENETKRNVQHSSSCHGSSDEEGLIDSMSKTIPITVANRNLSPTSSRNNSPLSPKSPQNNYNQSRSPSRTPDRNQSQASPVLRPPSVAKGNGAGLMARTLFDYDAAEDDELSFDVDELITNIEKIDVGWYRGIITAKNGSKRDGLFPANYVKLLNDEGEY